MRPMTDSRRAFDADRPDPAWDARHPDPASSGVAPYRLYNLGSEEPVELVRYVELLERALGRTAIRTMLPLQPGDVPDAEADMTDLRAAAGYVPATRVEEGIGRFVAWYRDYYRV